MSGSSSRQFFFFFFCCSSVWRESCTLSSAQEVARGLQMELSLYVSVRARARVCVFHWVKRNTHPPSPPPRPPPCLSEASSETGLIIFKSLTRERKSKQLSVLILAVRLRTTMNSIIVWTGASSKRPLSFWRVHSWWGEKKKKEKVHLFNF